MMNDVKLLGRLCADPDYKLVGQDQKPVCRFRIAVTRRFKNSQGERDTDYFPVVCWNSTAKFVSKYFVKGSQIIISGSLHNREWSDANGKHTVTEIIADEAYFAGGKPAVSQDSGNQDSDGGFGNDVGEGGFYPLENDDELPF